MGCEKRLHSCRQGTVTDQATRDGAEDAPCIVIFPYKAPDNH